MSRWIIDASLRIRFLIVILAAVLMVFGIVQLRDMPVDVYPEFNPPLVEVQTEALGLSAAEMEALITVPLEADLLNGVAWLDQIYSETVTGLSSILLVFEPGTDPIRARQMVQERLTETFALPNVSKPPTMLQPLSTSSRVMMVGLSSEELSLIDMGVLARWNIKPRLMGVPGVANVAIWGQREWQLQVQVDPERLQDAGVTLAQVIEASGEALWVSPLSYLESSSPGTAGWIDTPNQRLSIRHLLPIQSAADMSKISIQGTAYTLGDVVELVEDHQPLIGDAILNDGPGLLLVIEKFPGANTLEVTRGVEAALRAMAPGLSGIEIDTTVFRPASYIEFAAANLTNVVVISAILAVLVLGLFFFNWRSALVGLVAIPLALIGATFVLYLRDATFNIMVLAGLVVALGVIIDEAIVGVDNIMKRVRQHRAAGSDRSMERLVLDAMVETRSGLGFATLIVLLAVTPVFFLPDPSGAFLQPLAVTYVLAVLTALVISLTVTPAFSLLLLSIAPPKQGESALIRRVQRSYSGLLERSMQKPGRVLLIAAVLVVVSLVALPFLGVSLLPEIRQTDLRIQWEGAPGTSRPEMNRITSLATAELRAIPGVRNVGSHVGRAITGDQVVGINSGEVWVSIDPLADYAATVAAVREVMDGYPGLFREVETYRPERMDDVLIGANQEIVVRIFGHEYDVLNNQAKIVRDSLRGIDGVVEVNAEVLAVEPQVEIEVDISAAEQFQVKPGDVRRSATTLISGLQVGNLYEEQKVFDVVVWGIPEIRANLNDIEALLIDTPRGGHVTLGEIADVRISPIPIVIQRDAVSRFVDVTVSVSGRSLGAVAADVDKIVQGIPVPFEYHMEVLGQFAERQSAQQLALMVAAIVVLGTYLLLQASFGGWRLAFVILLSWPVALTGGVLAILLFGGGALSLGAVFGFLTVLGVAVRSSMMLIGRYQQIQLAEDVEIGPELVRRVAQEKAAPMLLTALTTGLALLPVAIMGPVAGLELIHPMALVIIGGLITSTWLNLFVMPVLYLRYGTSPEPDLGLYPAPVAGD